MKHQLFIIGLLLFSIDVSANKPTEVANNYYDGPYVLLEKKNTLRTVWVSDGELFEKKHSSKELVEFDEPSLPRVTIPEKYKWASKPKGKYETEERVVALSDIHGQYDVFVDLLRTHAIVDEDNNWSFQKGHLVITGDVMDRGDKVMECLWLIHKLEQQAQQAGGYVHFLLGNHELMVMNGNLDFLHRKYRYTSALLKTPYQELFSKDTALGNWLASKNVLVQINDVLYVHGGISQQTMSLNLGIDAINNTFKKELYYQDEKTIDSNPKLFTLYYDDGPLWYRGYAYPYSFNKDYVDKTLSELNLRSIVVGHTSLSNIKGLYDNRIVLIDSSIKLGRTGELFINDNGSYTVGHMDGTKTTLISEEQKTDDQISLFDYIYDQDQVQIRISHDLKTIEKNFKNDELETDGQISLVANRQELIFTAALKPGGKSRRKICALPPLKMNLKKSELETFNFIKDHDRMKIVFQCQTSSKYAETIKMEKFLYDLYGIVSPYGFRSKLVKVVLDGYDKRVDGFVIESDEDLQRRQNMDMIKVGTISTAVVDRPEYVKMCMFQYLIANVDWSAVKGHNTDLFKRKVDDSIVVIPYDFDYSGIIDNAYAVTPEQLPIEDVTQRYFMDKKIPWEELMEGVNFYVSKEREIYGLVEEASFLSDKSRKRLNMYIQSFYKTIKDKKKLKRMMK